MGFCDQCWVKSRYTLSVIIFFNWSWTLILEVIGVVLICVPLELWIGNRVAPAHHGSVLDGIISSWEPLLQVITLGVEAVVRGGSPLHQWGFEGGLSIKVDDPIVTHGLILAVVMNVLLLGHVDAGYFILISVHIDKGVTWNTSTSTTRNTLMRSLNESDLILVKLIICILLLDRVPLNGTILQLVSVWRVSCLDSKVTILGDFGHG